MFRSTLEMLPDEILLIIFQYFDDVYHLFQLFFGLNQRFNHLLLDRRTHLFTNFLYIHKSHENFHVYYDSIPFQTISKQILSLKTNSSELYPYFQSLISFHICEQYKQMNSELNVNLKKFQSIRQNLSPEEILHVDTNLKLIFENLRQPISKSSLQQIRSLVFEQGASLDYTSHEQSGFYFAEDFSNLIINSSLNYQTIEILKLLFISNSSLLTYPCYNGGYRLNICEFLFYYYYSFPRPINRLLINLILFTIQYQKHLFSKSNWIERILQIIFDIFSKKKSFKTDDMLFQMANFEILNILFEEYHS